MFSGESRLRTRKVSVLELMYSGTLVRTVEQQEWRIQQDTVDILTDALL